MCTWGATIRSCSALFCRAGLGMLPASTIQAVLGACCSMSLDAPPQNSSRYVEIFTSNREEVDRRALTGVMLV